VGLISIATGKYVSLLYQLSESARQHLLPGNEVTQLVFSDRMPPPEVLMDQAKCFCMPHLPWPLVTLLRYHYILGAERYLLDAFDYLFYLDVDMRLVDTVGDEILGDLVAVIHPCFYNRPAREYPFERRPQSTAAIQHLTGTERYYQGSFQGGRTSVWLIAAKTMRDRINKDLDNRVIAVWHDESHWNKVLIETPPTVALPPAYSYPESLGLPFPPKILALDKNHQEIRS
jgi:histo-blood group ABO system transferase